MSLIEIPDELAIQLRDAARAEGQAYEEFVLARLRAVAEPHAGEARQFESATQSPESKEPISDQALLQDPSTPRYLRAALKASAAIAQDPSIQLPPDGSINADHYLYGAPKRAS